MLSGVTVEADELNRFRLERCGISIAGTALICVALGLIVVVVVTAAMTEIDTLSSIHVSSNPCKTNRAMLSFGSI